MTKIYMWQVTFYPNKKVDTGITCMTLTIIARNEEFARLYAMQASSFLNQDLITEWSKPIEGYTND